MGNFSEEQNRLLDAIRKMEADGVPEDKIRQVVEYAKQKNPSLVSGKAKQQPAFSLAPPPEPKMKGALGAIEAQGIEVPTKPSGETMPDIGKEESRLRFIGRSLKDFATKEAPRGLGMAGSFIAPYGMSPAGQAARLEAAVEIEEVNKQRRQDYPKLSTKPATDVFSNPTDLDAWTAAASTIMPTAAAMITAPLTGGGSAAALTGSYFGSSLANSYTEGIKSGLDDTQSMLYGTVMGSIEAAAENLGLDALTKIPKSWLSKTVKESVKKYGKDGAEKTLKESMKAITAWLAKRGVGAAQGSAVGFLEEGATSLGQSGTQLAFDAATGSELFDPNKQVPQGGVVGEVFGRALEAGAGGVIGEGLIGGVRGIETRDSGKEDSSLDELEQARQKELEESVPFLRWQRENAKQFNSNPRKGIVYYINAYENSLKQAKDERTKKEIEDEIRKAKLNLQAYDEINAKYNALKQNSTSPDAEIDETDLEALSEPPAPISEPPIDPTAPPVTDTAPLDPNTPEGAADIATEVLTQKADELDEDLAALSQLDEEVVTDEVDRVEQALQGYRETEEFDDEQLEAMRPFFQEIYNLDDELAAITSKESKDSLGILKKKYSQRKKDIAKRRKEIDKAISDIAEGNFARASAAAVVEEDLPELMAELAPDVEMPVVAAEPVMGEAVTPTEIKEREADIERRRQEELKQVKPISFSDNEIKQKQENQQRRVDNAKEIISFGKTFSEALDNIMKRQEELNNILNKRQKEETKDREVHQYTKEELEAQPEYQEIKRLDKLINSINDVYTEGKSENFKNSTQEALDFENQELEAIPSKRKRNSEEISKINAKYDAELADLKNKPTATTEVVTQEEVVAPTEIAAKEEKPTNRLNWREAYKKADPYRKASILREIARSGTEKELSDVLDMLVKRSVEEGNIAWEVANRTKSRETFERAVSNKALKKSTTDENISLLRSKKFGDSPAVTPTEIDAKEENVVKALRFNGVFYIDENGDVSKELRDKLDKAKSEKNLKELDDIYNSVRVVLNGPSQARGQKTVEQFQAIKSELEDFAKQLKQSNKKDETEPMLEGLPSRRDKGEGGQKSPELRTEEAKQEKVVPPLAEEAKADGGGSNTPTISDFEAISAKGEKGRKARAELTKRLGKDTVNDMTRITANFESIINNLENQGKIRKECP